MAWLLYAQPYDEAVPGLRSLYFSDVGFTTKPSDSPANVYWDRRIEVPLTVNLSLYSGSDVGGRSEVGFGEITLANDDGDLDGLADYDWDGRLVEVRFTDKEKPELGDFAVVFTGTAERLVPGDTLTIEIRDLQILLDEPYQKNVFAGTGGVEGPTEFKDRRKPRCLGVVRQVSPILLNEPAQIWCCNDGPSGGPLAVKDGGVALTATADYATYALLEAATITGGAYGTCNALGLIKLGVKPTGVFTVDYEGVKASGVVAKKFANIASYVITTSTSLTAGDFATGTLAANASACPQTLGHWYNGSQELTVKGVLDLLAQSGGIYYGFDDARKLVIGRLDAPAAGEDFSVFERDVLELRPLPVERRLKSQIIRWGQKHRALEDNEIAGAITGSARQALIEEWLQEKFESSAVATVSLLAREETLDSGFDSAADAQAEAQRRVGLYGPKRQAFECTVRFRSDLRPGQTVKLFDQRFGLATGKNFRVMRVQRKAVEQETVVELWG